MIEAGFPDLVSSNWWAIAAPKGTPEPVLGLLNDAVVEALGSPTVAETFGTLGMRVPTKTRAQFVASLRSEAEAVV